MQQIFRALGLGLAAAVSMSAGPAFAESGAPEADPGGEARIVLGPDAPATWRGQSLDGLEAVRDALRAERAAGRLAKPVTVVLEDGAYPIRAPFTLTPEDSGAADAPVTFIAAPGARPVLHGGVALRFLGEEQGRWILAIPPEAPADLAFNSLWVNGERRTAARLPNPAHPAGDYPPDSDFFRTAGPVMETNEAGESVPSRTRLRYDPETFTPPDDLRDAMVVVFHSWETSLHRVAGVDPEAHEIHFTGPAVWPFTQWQQNQRFFVQHTRAGLDAPGQWFHDRKNRTVHYVPLPDEDPETAEAVIPLAQTLLKLEGDPEAGAYVEHVHFHGIAFRYTDQPIAQTGHSDPQAAVSTGAAVVLRGARHCSFEACTIANTGNYGIWFQRGSADCVLRASEITDLGAGGVRIGESGDLAGPAARITVDNCFIHDGGHIFRGGVGVFIQRSSHNEITHNEICDFRYTGVSVGWNWGYAESQANHNRIAYNRIHHIGLGQLNDMGGVYTLGVSPGTVVRGNVIHRVHSHPELYGGWGLYTDEGSTDIVMENNLVYDTQTGGFHQHYGKDNRIQNNIFAYSRGPQIVRTRDEEHRSFYFERNIVYFNNGELLGSSWRNDQFFLDHNCYWDESSAEVHFQGQDLEAWRARGHDQHSLVADPLFAEPARGDFTLAGDSPVFMLGFDSFDASKAGLYGDPEWVARPRAIVRTPFTPPAPARD